MKKIFVIILIGFIFVSCVPKDRIVYVDKNVISIEKENPYPVHINDFCNFQKIITECFETIYVDKNTDVLYYYKESGTYKCGITPIMEADGTPLTYTEWKERNR